MVTLAPEALRGLVATQAQEAWRASEVSLAPEARRAQAVWQVLVAKVAQQARLAQEAWQVPVVKPAQAVWQVPVAKRAPEVSEVLVVRPASVASRVSVVRQGLEVKRVSVAKRVCPVNGSSKTPDIAAIPKNNWMSSTPYTADEMPFPNNIVGPWRACSWPKTILSLVNWRPQANVSKRFLPNSLAPIGAGRWEPEAVPVAPIRAIPSAITVFE